MSKQIITSIIIVAILGIGVGSWFYFSKPQQEALTTDEKETTATPQPTIQKKSATPPAGLTTTEKVTARSFAEKVLKLLQSRDYSKIYDLLTEEDRAATTRAEYVKERTETLGALIITSWQIKEVLEEQGGASIQYVVNYTSPLGSSSETGILTLVQKNGKWFLSIGAIDVSKAVIRGVGDEIVLATMKFRVNTVREQQTISTQHGSSASAKESTRFVVVDLTITNITKSGVMFPADYFILEDNQGRKFETYGNTIGSIDNYLNARNLSPSVPERGVIVYEIPIDATSYWFVVAKAGTNDVYKVILK